MLMLLNIKPFGKNDSLDWQPLTCRLREREKLYWGKGKKKKKENVGGLIIKYRKKKKF